MKLILDYREKQLISYFEKSIPENFTFGTESLKCGDILLKDDNDTLILLIERKTISDLLSSIGDGRYREQKARLISNYNIQNIAYLIEDVYNEKMSKYSNNKNSESIMYGAMINLMWRDHIKIIRTVNLADTIKFLENLMRKIIKTPKLFSGENAIVENKQNCS